MTSKMTPWEIRVNEYFIKKDHKKPIIPFTHTVTIETFAPGLAIIRKPVVFKNIKFKIGNDYYCVSLIVPTPLKYDGASKLINKTKMEYLRATSAHDLGFRFGIGRFKVYKNGKLLKLNEDIKKQRKEAKTIIDKFMKVIFIQDQVDGWWAKTMRWAVGSLIGWVKYNNYYKLRKKIK